MPPAAFITAPCLFPLALACTLLASSLGSSLGAGEMTDSQRHFFEAKIRPALVTHCYECHAADSKKLGGKLLLDGSTEILAGGQSGPALIPGDPDSSLLLQALRYDGLEMPPSKPLPPAIITDFEQWIRMGAPDPRPSGSTTAKPSVTADLASLWAYQARQSPPTPAVSSVAWPRSSIDSFILAAMERAQLSPSPDATPATLIRRLHFDLIGLPPTADEVDTFVAACGQSLTAPSAELAIQTLADQLLQSPHFGERWGRHWLDVARYAESNGNDGLSRNPSFPHAWRYRDYVIAAFNEDLPYHRFITEQIAGDLLTANNPAERDRHLIATGFLALCAKPAKAMNENFEMDVVADQIDLVGSGILGLTVACARCHDHKTDPISTREYYAIAGIFKSTETLWGAAAMQGLTAPQTPLHELHAHSNTGPHPALDAVFAAYKPRRPPAKTSFSYPPENGLAMGVRDAKTIADCALNITGESKKLGPKIPRGFLQTAAFGSLDLPVPASASGRLQLAQWLAHPANPQPARVLVNRVWLHLFGQGIVRTPDDFGVFGDRPSHPALLDHLATRFIAEGWSIKKLIRHLVLSRTYRQASDHPTSHESDPSNRWFTRQSLRRLDAEALRDAILACSGQLDRQPAQGSLIQSRDVLINELGNLHQPSRHRSVYLLMLRNAMPPELTPFNLPDAVRVTGQRDTSTLATQALYLLNNPFLITQSQHFAHRLLDPATPSTERVRTAYRAAFSRNPSPQEIQRAESFLQEVELTLVSSQPNDSQRTLTAWTTFCQALLASSELRYLD